MKRFTLLALAVLGLGSACGTSPQQACKDILSVECNKMYTCNTGSDLDAIKSIFGATEADCVTKLNSTANCDNVGTSCSSGKTYNAVAATTCVNDLRALSCSAFGSGSGSNPSSCSSSSICQ